MRSRTALAIVASLVLLILAGQCADRPPWPGAGDPDKDRTNRAEVWAPPR